MTINANNPIPIKKKRDKFQNKYGRMKIKINLNELQAVKTIENNTKFLNGKHKQVGRWKANKPARKWVI